MDFDSLSQRYYGGIARHYDGSRENSRQWANERAAVEMFFDKLPTGLSVIDVPVGTGRFVEIYRRRNLAAKGIDASSDMLQLASEKIEKAGFEMPLTLGDIRAIDEPDENFDVAVCIRFLNWINDADVLAAVRQLRRVSRRYLILGARHFVPAHEIRPFSTQGLKRYSRQLLRRAKGHIIVRRAPKIIVHEKSRVMQIFDDCGLNIVGQVCVDSSRNGTDYNIYLLEKRAEK